jgi:4-methylaminobutanoate oxidase (formaldehyde-forming)
MVQSADVVIIGSGGFGSATAYFLMRRGGRRVVLLDRHELASQTSPRAAGNAATLRSTDLMTRLASRAVEWLLRFSRDTGQPLDVVQSGSLKAARRPEDAAILEQEAVRGQRLGLGTTVVSPEEAHRRHPFFQPDGVRSVLHTPGDAYFEPPQVASGYATAAGQLGATLLARTTVTGIHVEGGAVQGVETDRGRIESPVVVDAAGAWARQVAARAGVYVPLVPTRHQVLITEPIAGVTADLPIVRIMDASVYVRPCWGGFLAGGYESEPTQFDMDQLPEAFSMADTPLDLALLSRLLAGVRDQLPVLQEAPIRVHRGGIPTMTPDGQHIVGLVPGAAGFFIASGCNVAGLSIAPAIAEQLASWIVDGRPTEDLGDMSIARFGPEWRDERRLREAAAWHYWHFYSYRAESPEAIAPQLEACYAAVEAAFQRKDLDAVAGFLTTDFVAYEPDGTAVGREQVLASTRRMLETLRDITWLRTITRLVLDGDDAIATVEGIFGATRTGEDGQPQRIELDLSAEDVWTRSGGGWRNRSARSLRRIPRAAEPPRS